MNLGSVEKWLWVSVITLMIIWTEHHGFEGSCAVKELLSVKLLPVWLVSDDIDFAVFSQDLPPAIRPGSHVWWVCVETCYIFSIIQHSLVCVCYPLPNFDMQSIHTCRKIHQAASGPEPVLTGTHFHIDLVFLWICCDMELVSQASFCVENPVKLWM